MWPATLPPEGLQPVVMAFGGDCSVAEINRLVAEGRRTAAGAVEGMRYSNRHPALVLVDTDVVARAPKRHLMGGLVVDAGNDDQLRTIAARSLIPGDSRLNELFLVMREAKISALKAADQLRRQLH